MPRLQEDAFEVIAAPVVEDVLSGVSGTIVAYGQVTQPNQIDCSPRRLLTPQLQTGTGKTFTMFGDPREGGSLGDGGRQPVSANPEVPGGRTSGRIRTVLRRTGRFLPQPSPPPLPVGLLRRGRATPQSVRLVGTEATLGAAST